ncbi:MAG: glycosyltransferase [Candidatus Microsaccharimonas sp.]
MTKKEANPVFSVVITAHREGIIAHKTLVSIQKALEPLYEIGISYEVVIHIDNGDTETNAYFDRYKSISGYTLLYNSFGNPADSRNFAINAAKGKYIALIDGDDLITKDWLIDGYKMLAEQDKPVILRPNYQLQFGGTDPHHNVWILNDSFSKDEDALIMSYYNRWPNALITTADILKEFPFVHTKNGFGYEDWLFNCAVRMADIPNLVVPKSTLFYRRRANSVTSDHTGTILPYSPLFDIDYIKSLPPPSPVTEQRKASKLKKGVKAVELIATKAIKHIPALRSSVGPAAYKVLYQRQMKKLPKDVLDAWKYLNSLDSQTWPTQDAINGVRYHPLSFDQHNASLGYVYKNIVEQLSVSHSDYLFLVPKLSTGGTEKLLFNYIGAIKKAHPSWHITVLSPLPANHPYAIPDGVDFIDFDGVTSQIDWHERDVMWSRLLVQLGVKRLHIINHEGWYRWIAAHQKLLVNNNYTINTSMFMQEYTEEEGRIRSFAEPYLNDIYPSLNKVFTDNTNIIRDIISRDGFDSNKLTVHYQPSSTATRKPEPIVLDNERPLRVLWASRLSLQKRPDIVKEIGKKLDAKKFHIDVYGREQHFTGQFFKDIESITYKGEFSGIETIPTNEYDVYLYTSSVDGVPNILLEIASLGLPIIASDDGGVGEFVLNKKTGLLCAIENIDDYVQALEFIRANPEKALQFAKASQKLLKTQHSVELFEKNIARDIN